MRKIDRLLAVLGLLILVAGCGGGPDADKMIAARADTKIKKLAILYSTFQTGHGWVGPADEAEFRTYIDGISENRLRRLQIDKSDVDDLFKSERDGQPYRIRWGIPNGNGFPRAPILFEANGVEGSFMVGFTNGTSQEFSKAEYDKLWSGESDGGSMTGQSAGGRPNGRPAAPEGQ